MKHTACYHLPGLFEFYELYRSGSTGNIFMTGARSAPSTVRRQIASGAGAAWRPGSTPPPKFWP